MKFFRYDKANGNIEIDDDGEIFLIKEFNDLINLKRNITKEDKTGKNRTLAFKELKYIYLFFDWQSIYFPLIESEKHINALRDSELSDEEFNNSEFRAACRKYDEMQNSSLDLKMLKSAMGAVEKQIFYLDNVDLQERDILTGKPIFKSKDLIAEIKGCRDLISTLRELEVQVKKGLDIESNVRGNTELGMFDN
jgi:hypothetical protein